VLEAEEVRMPFVEEADEVEILIPVADGIDEKKVEMLGTELVRLLFWPNADIE